MIAIFFAVLCAGASRAAPAPSAAPSGTAAAPAAAPAAPRPRRAVFAPARGLIHPIYDINLLKDHEDPWLQQLREKTEELVRRIESEGVVSDISLQFASMERTAQFDIAPEIAYKPASMTKVPIMMTFLKQNEDDRGLLSRELVLRQMPPAQFTPEFPPKVRLTPGKTYTINELLDAMIAHSDNDAAYTLFTALSPGRLTRMYEDLGVKGPTDLNPNELMTARDYAIFLRSLYLASYLEWDRSQLALEYLSATDFDEGLRAQLPRGTTIAHKFGEAAAFDGKRKQIHDCGFVYHPKGPYLLCVFTRGTEQHGQAAAIARISKLVYDEMDKLPPEKDAPRVGRP